MLAQKFEVGNSGILRQWHVRVNSKFVKQPRFLPRPVSSVSRFDYAVWIFAKYRKLKVRQNWEARKPGPTATTKQIRPE